MMQCLRCEDFSLPRPSLALPGMLMRSYGLRVTTIKIDPYLNIDAGTMSPFEHGEARWPFLLLIPRAALWPCARRPQPLQFVLFNLISEDLVDFHPSLLFFR